MTTSSPARNVGRDYVDRQGSGADNGRVGRRRPAAIERWLEDQVSANTRAAYGADVADFVAWCTAESTPPLAATASDISRYRDHCLRSGLKPTTVRRRLSAIASLFRHADAAAGDGIPVDEVARPDGEEAPPELLDDDELDGVVHAARGLGPKVEALVSLLARDGIKLGEALELDVPQLTGTARRMTATVVRRRGDVELALDPVTSAALATYLGERRRGPLFLGGTPNGDGPTRLTRFGANFIVKRAAAAARIDKPVSANVLRRSYIARAHREGAAIVDIQAQVGHGQLRLTSRVVADAR